MGLSIFCTDTFSLFYYTLEEGAPHGDFIMPIPPFLVHLTGIKWIPPITWPSSMSVGDKLQRENSVASSTEHSILRRQLVSSSCFFLVRKAASARNGRFYNCLKGRRFWRRFLLFNHTADIFTHTALYSFYIVNLLSFTLGLEFYLKADLKFYQNMMLYW
jgi:hypothetical protein